MIEASCHCGDLKMQIETPPQTVTHCNCSICRRYGTLCTYYSPKQVTITGATDTYMWGDRSIVFHRCKNCGCFAYWSAVDKSYDRMGVNARLMTPDVLAAAAVREFDGANM